MTTYRKHAWKAALLALAAFLLPATAQAAAGFATANVNMRSGPGTGYPAVTVIPVGTSVEIHGCLADIAWCDVSFYYARGWVAARYVQVEYQQSRVYLEPDYYDTLGIPFVTFEIGNYWDRYYRNRDFYRQRDYYRGDRDDYRRNRDYYRRDTDGDRYQRDRRIRRDYEAFDRMRRGDDGEVFERSRRDRDRARIERRDGDRDRIERRDRGRDRIERRDRNRDRDRAERRRRDDVREFRDRRERDRDRPRVQRRDTDRDHSRNRDSRRRCRPGDDRCD
ncbi:SH3 domain-containing protein [Pararhizobium sp. A13]|uniref:SH3 domain-containing protein n=1 Tax=Pararhizobium sp. A13 TaxID=3133975 RepID=UPI00324CBBDA